MLRSFVSIGINVSRSTGFSRLHFSDSLKCFPLTKTWQFQQLLVYFANQKGSDVQNIMSWSLTHGTGIVKGLYHHGHNGVCVVHADLSISLFLRICLVREVVGREGGWLSYIVSPSPPYPLLAQAMAEGDRSIVAVVWRNLSYWKRLYELRLTLLLVPAHCGLSIVCERCWIKFCVTLSKSRRLRK